jgi:hypothetical protein
MSDASNATIFGPDGLIRPGVPLHQECPADTAAEIGPGTSAPSKTLSASLSMLSDLQCAASDLANFIRAARAVEVDQDFVAACIEGDEAWSKGPNLVANHHNLVIIDYLYNLFTSVERASDSCGEVGIGGFDSIRAKLWEILRRWGWQDFLTSGGPPCGRDDPAAVLSPGELAEMIRALTGLQASLITLTVNSLTCAMPKADPDGRGDASEAPAATGPSKADTLGSTGPSGPDPAGGRSGGAASPLSPDRPARSGMDSVEGISLHAHPSMPQSIRLDQAAAMAHMTKRALENYKRRGMPKPTRQGRGGRFSLYSWPEMRVWLERTFDLRLPEHFPDPGLS